MVQNGCVQRSAFAKCVEFIAGQALVQMTIKIRKVKYPDWAY
jgi:hypothetical protein